MASLFSPSGPALPAFRTLLVQGQYHPTAPIHLVLSHTTNHPSAKAILLSTSRQNLVTELKLSLDEWLTVHGGEGGVCNSASRVNIFYPHTPAHLALLLSMLHTYNGTFYQPKTTVDRATSLLVLHELSAYFLPEDSEATMSSYLSLVSYALAAASNLSSDSSDVALALFDSGLDLLKLPVLRPISHEVGEDEPPPPRKEPVAGFVHKFFDWIGVVTVAAAPTPPEDAPSSERSVAMILRRGESEITWRWSESPSANGTVFTWMSVEEY